MDNGILILGSFVVASGLLVYVSRKSLRCVRSHGFYRFFAWEAILGLVLLNLRSWFFQPFSILQIISWILLSVSLLLLQQSLQLIRAAGKPGSPRRGDPLLWFEKTTELVTSGIYHFIRHPMYSSLLFLAWGAFLKGINGYTIVLVSVSTISLVATAKADEAECIQYFGTSYKEYMTYTKMFVPFLF
jgi:protein-S-isoprenylcysteine O-methyltransferase Ste14